MSDSTAVAVISFLAPAGFLLHFYISNSAVNLVSQIVSGHAQGVPIPTGARRALLWQIWVPCMVVGVAHMTTMALSCVTVAALVGHPQVKLLCYVVAFVPGIGSLWYLVNAIAGARKYDRFLRKL